MCRFSFRIRFRLPEDHALNVDVPTWSIPTIRDDPPVLISTTNESAIKTSRLLILLSNGWKTETAASTAGSFYQSAFKLAIARLGAGVDFGARTTGKGIIFKAGLDRLERATGTKVLNESDGVMVFETDAKPKFASVGPVSACVAHPVERLGRFLAHAVNNYTPIGSHWDLALDLYSASFFETSIDSRFLGLMMAIETILEFAPRPMRSLNHVELLIRQTKNAHDLEPGERESLLGSLRYLQNESISQAGQRLARERLGEVRRYGGQSPVAFFKACYNLRSTLVHGGDPRPGASLVATQAAELRKFTSDLLSGPLLAVGE